MKILGKELAASGRWYIALPPLLLLGFLTGLYLTASAGQTRLADANARMRESQERQQALSEFVTLVTDAESNQRGYLLTGAREYRDPYLEAVQKVPASLERIRLSYGVQNTESPQLRDLRLLTGRKLGELEDGMALFKQRGSASAASVVRTDVSKRSMVDVVKLVGAMRGRETADLAVAMQRWRSDVLVSRWVTALGLTANIVLVALATVLVGKDMRRRSRQAVELMDHSSDLEAQVAARTRDLHLLLAHLQGVSEQEKLALARELHDELGGQLVAARMDLSWLQQRLSGDDAAIEQRFKRIHDSLTQSIDLKRRVVEELRPTLLDNMGLFTALRWMFQETCARSGLESTESVPDVDVPFDPAAAIGVYRLTQEVLRNIVAHSHATVAGIAVVLEAEDFVLRVTDDGKGISADSTERRPGLMEMRHRISAMGGTWTIGQGDNGGTLAVARIPLRVMRGAEP